GVQHQSGSGHRTAGNYPPATTLDVSAGSMPSASSDSRREMSSGARKNGGTSAMPPRTDVGVELIRVVACFMVVLLHVAASGFHDFADAWWPSNFHDAFTRVCVP